MAAPIVRNVGAVARTVFRTSGVVNRTGVCRIFDTFSTLSKSSRVQTPASFHSASFLKSDSSITVTDEPDTLYQKIEVLVKGHDKSVLDSYEFFATMAAKELGVGLGKVYEPPKYIERMTLLKSPHIFKKHRVQYEMRTHYRCIELSRITGSTAQVYLEYIQRNLPEGVAMEITRTAIEKIPEHIQKPLWDDVSKTEEQSKQ